MATYHTLDFCVMWNGGRFPCVRVTRAGRGHPLPYFRRGPQSTFGTPLYAHLTRRTTRKPMLELKPPGPAPPRSAKLTPSALVYHEPPQ